MLTRRPTGVAVAAPAAAGAVADLAVAADLAAAAGAVADLFWEAQVTWTDHTK